VHFYEIEGLLVRRWVPAGRRVGLEVWKGDGWARYPDVEHLLRYGRRLNEAEALALLQKTRDRTAGLAAFSNEEARLALCARLRRA
jgi:hypothetical protein